MKCFKVLRKSCCADISNLIEMFIQTSGRHSGLQEEWPNQKRNELNGILNAAGECKTNSSCSHMKDTYLLTYLLTPWSTVLLEKLTGFAANQEILRILWSQKVHYRTHKRSPPVPILSQLHSVPDNPFPLPQDPS